MPGLEAFDHDLPNPLDRIERLAEAHHWSFDRATPSEVVMRLEGGWSDLSLSMCWREDLETLQVAAAFDLKVPPPRREEVGRLLALINEQQLAWPFRSLAERRVHHLSQQPASRRRGRGQRCPVRSHDPAGAGSL